MSVEQDIVPRPDLRGDVPESDDRGQPELRAMMAVWLVTPPSSVANPWTRCDRATPWCWGKIVGDDDCWFLHPAEVILGDPPVRLRTSRWATSRTSAARSLR